MISRVPTGRDDQSLIDHRDAIAQGLGFADVVGRQPHRVSVALHPQDFAVELAARLRVEAGRRLVEEDQLGLVDEGERQREALALAAGQRIERGVRLVHEPESLEQRRRVGLAAIERAEQRRAPRAA